MIWLLGLGIPALAADFAGSAACAECHRSHYERQRDTHHARALRPIAGSPLAELLVKQSRLRERRLQYRYEPAGSQVAVTVESAGETAAAMIEWAFGSGAQGITPVGRAGGRWIEHRISWYAAPARLSVTAGHPAASSSSAEQALGVPQDSATIARCFGCHATNARLPGVSSLTPGVQCERCHGPGAAHIAAARAGQAPQRSILSPARFPTRARVEMCGECHRTPPAFGASATPELDDPLSVRFQPVGLMASRCFLQSRTLSCSTCHDPHENARHNDPQHYTAKCLSCHQKPARAASACRRNKGENCLSCHMQRVSPAPYLSFVDHRIRVY